MAVACMRELLAVLDAVARDLRPWTTPASTPLLPTQSLQGFGLTSFRLPGSPAVPDYHSSVVIR